MYPAYFLLKMLLLCVRTRYSLPDCHYTDVKYKLLSWFFHSPLCVFLSLAPHVVCGREEFSHHKPWFFGFAYVIAISKWYAMRTIIALLVLLVPIVLHGGLPLFFF